MQALATRVTALENSLSQLIQHLTTFHVAPKITKLKKNPVQKKAVQFPGNISPLAASSNLKEQIWTTTPRLVLFDFETTGIGKTNNIAIREVGAVSFETSAAFRKAVNPWKATSKVAFEIAPDASDLQKAENWCEVAPQFLTWLDTQLDDEPEGKLYLAGWNSKRYDSRIFMYENQRSGIDLDKYKQKVYFVDMLEVTKILRPDIKAPRTLSRVYEIMVGKTITSAHTALGDSEAVKSIALILAEKHKDKFWQKIEEKSENIHAVMKRCEISA